MCLVEKCLVCIFCLQHSRFRAWNEVFRHDWNDSDCVKILKGVKNAMSSSSCLLIRELHPTIIYLPSNWEKIDEFIVQPGYRIPVDEAKFTQAPEPLLPNYGEGRIRQHTLDVHMMTQINGQERSLDGFITLGEATGLRFSKLWDTGEMGLVEFTKAWWLIEYIVCQ